MNNGLRSNYIVKFLHLHCSILDLSTPSLDLEHQPTVNKDVLDDMIVSRQQPRPLHWLSSLTTSPCDQSVVTDGPGYPMR